MPCSKVVPNFGASIFGASDLPTAPNINELATETIALFNKVPAAILPPEIFAKNAGE